VDLDQTGKFRAQDMPFATNIPLVISVWVGGAARLRSPTMPILHQHPAPCLVTLLPKQRGGEATSRSSPSAPGDLDALECVFPQESASSTRSCGAVGHRADPPLPGLARLRSAAPVPGSALRGRARSDPRWANQYTWCCCLPLPGRASDEGHPGVLQEHDRLRGHPAPGRGFAHPLLQRRLALRRHAVLQQRPTGPGLGVSSQRPDRYINTTFPKGQALRSCASTWRRNHHIGQIPLKSLREDFLPSGDPPHPVVDDQQFPRRPHAHTFNTPVGAPGGPSVRARLYATSTSRRATAHGALIPGECTAGPMSRAGRSCASS